MLNPVFRHKINAIIYISVWLVIAGIHTFILNKILNFDLTISLMDSLVYNSLYALLGISLWYPAIYLSLDGDRLSRTVVNHIATGMLSAWLWVYAGRQFINLFASPSHTYITFLDNSFVWRLAFGLLFYFSLIAFYYVIFYYENYKNKIQEETELRALVKESELKALKYQLNPHFIFNSLNSIASLTLSDPEKAREMTLSLSSFLRHILSYDENKLCSFGDELETIHRYMAIEKIRFGERLDFSERNCKTFKNLPVPSMILQPLFENIIKHAIHNSDEKISVRLSCQESTSYVEIHLENTLDPTAIIEKGEGIGLKNISDRLQLIYNMNHLLTIQKSESLFKVIIKIPK